MLAGERGAARRERHRIAADNVRNRQDRRGRASGAVIGARAGQCDRARIDGDGRGRPHQRIVVGRCAAERQIAEAGNRLGAGILARQGSAAHGDGNHIAHHLIGYGQDCRGHVCRAVIDFGAGQIDRQRRDCQGSRRELELIAEVRCQRAQAGGQTIGADMRARSADRGLAGIGLIDIVARQQSADAVEGRGLARAVIDLAVRPGRDRQERRQ